MNSLLKLLNLRRNELSRLVHAAAVFFLASIEDGIVKSVAAAVFNTRAGVDQLPLMYTWIAVLFSLSMVLLSVLTARVARQRLLMGLLGGLGVVLVFNSSVLFLERGQDALAAHAWFYPFLFISSELVRSLAGFQVWIMAGGICYTSRAKVFFPLFAASATLGDISSGLLVRLLGPVLESYQLYGLAALSMGAIIVLMRPLLRRYFIAPAGGGEEGGASLPENLRYFGRSGYLKALFVLSVAVLTLYTAIHYSFNVQAAERFPAAAETTGFFGLFYGATGAATLVVTFFLLRLVLRWVGVGNVYAWGCGAYLLLCLGLAGAFAGSLPLPGLWVVFAANLVNFLLLDSLVAPVYQVLIKLVPQRHSDGTRMIMEGGFMLAGGLAGAGVTALHAQQLLSLEEVFMTLAGLSAAMVGVGWYLKKSYTAVLVRAVREQDLFVDNAHALESLRKLISGSGEFARSLLQHRDDQVRQLGIEILKKSQEPATAAACLSLVDHENPRIRSAALEALGHSGAQDQVVARVLPLVGDADEEVRLSAARVLAQRLGKAGLSPALRQEVIAAITPRLLLEAGPIQAELCCVLEQLQDRDSAELCRQLVQRLLDSGEVSQIIAGIRAAQQLETGDNHLRMRLHLRHSHPAVREAAVRSLAGQGEVLEELVQMLADPDPDVVEAVVQVLQQVRDPHQRQVLVASLPTQPPRVWEGLLAALLGMDDPALAPRLLASCQERLREANRCLGAIGLLRRQAQEPAVGLLIDQLRLQNQQVQNGVIRLLGALSDASVVRDLVERLSSRDREGREKAIELLENIGDRALLALLLPLIEAEIEGTPAPAPGFGDWEGRELQETLGHLLGSPDPWTQMAVVWAMASLGQDPAQVPAGLAPQARELIAQLEAQERGGTSMAAEDLPLTTMDKIAFLKGSSFFAALPLEELYHIALSVQEETVQPGNAVIREGTRGDKMYIVVRGKLEVRTAAAGPQGPPIAVLAEKQVFGEMSLLDDEPRSASVIAVEEAHLLSLQRGDLERILRRYSSIAFGMMRILSRRLRESMAA